MLYIKEASFEDAEKEWQFVATMPADENGLTNKWHGITRDIFLSKALPEMINHAKGIDLPDGFVPDTTLFLWNDTQIVGQFRLRHYLPATKIPGHIGYFIAKEHRGKGFATEGLRLTLEYGASIIPEDEYYMRLNKDNPASLRVMLKNGGRIVGETEDKLIVKIPKNKKNYVCKIASLQEMEEKWDYEIKLHPGQENWIIWKAEAIKNYQTGRSIPYYGILDGTIICEATAVIDPGEVQNSAGMMDKKTAYLCAFRTVKEYQGKGYFSDLLRFMLDDLKQKGFAKAVLGVEPDDKKNKAMYRHWGFTEFIKSATERYPDGTVIEVEYYGRDIEN